MSLNWTSQNVSPAEGTEAESVSANLLLFRVPKPSGGGDNLYYVTTAEVGTTEANWNVWILKSTDDGVTWTQLYNGPRRSAFPFCAVLSGTVIYIFNDVDNPPNFFRFDTSSDAFLTDSSPSGVSMQDGRGASAAVYADGTVSFAYISSSGDPACILYDPPSDSWGTPAIITDIVLTTGVVELVGQSIDTSNNIAFIFFLIHDTDARHVLIYCTPVQFLTPPALPWLFTVSSGLVCKLITLPQLASGLQQSVRDR